MSVSSEVHPGCGVSAAIPLRRMCGDVSCQPLTGGTLQWPHLTGSPDRPGRLVDERGGSGWLRGNKGASAESSPRLGTGCPDGSGKPVGGADGLDCRGTGIRVPWILRVWERDFGVVGLWSG